MIQIVIKRMVFQLIQPLIVIAMLETFVIFAFTSEIVCDNTLEGKPIGYYTRFWKTASAANAYLLDHIITVII